ncbi:hypothetical protein [Kaistella polysaccharea]|uniref:hypothetical protein n=1 Tax=Kaistella polysaccharea TaxID=2878534 RepID=UPI001CF3F442|nr:hypothetical protein [Kaistella polysaccharea]
MKTDLLLPENMLYSIILFGLIFVSFPLVFDLSQIGISSDMEIVFISLGLFANFIASVLLIIDVFKNNLSLKYFWTLSFLFLGGIAGFVYIRNREYYLSNRK